MQDDQTQNLVQRKTPPYWLVVVILVLLVTIGAVVYFWHQRQEATAPLYSYKNISSVSVAGKEKGLGMSFDKPVELTQISSSQGQAEFEHLQTLSNGKKKMISYIAAASSLDSEVISQDQLNVLNTQLTDAKYFSQSSYSLTSLNSFLKDRLPEGWQTSLSHGYIFTNSTIKKNAWYFNVTSKYQKTKQELDGKVVYVISRGSHYYYFTVIAQPNDWQSNSLTWDSVLSSLKIDQ